MKILVCIKQVPDMESKFKEEASSMNRQIEEIKVELQSSNEELQKSKEEIEKLKKENNNQNLRYLKMFKILILGMNSRRVKGVNLNEAFKKFLSEEFPGEDLTEDVAVRKAFGKAYQGFSKDDMTE